MDKHDGPLRPDESMQVYEIAREIVKEEIEAMGKKRQANIKDLETKIKDLETEMKTELKKKELEKSATKDFSKR